MLCCAHGCDDVQDQSATNKDELLCADFNIFPSHYILRERRRCVPRRELNTQSHARAAMLPARNDTKTFCDLCSATPACLSAACTAPRCRSTRPRTTCGSSSGTPRTAVRRCTTSQSESHRAAATDPCYPPPFSCALSTHCLCGHGSRAQRAPSTA